MQSILSVTVPFFALVLCGYLAARTKFLPESVIPGLNGFVLFLALPCMLFRFGAALAIALGAPLSPFTLSVLVLAAALPSASSVSLLAERYGADNGRIARAIVASTVLAFVTFTLIAWASQAVPG